MSLPRCRYHISGTAHSVRNEQPLEAEVWGSPDQSASSPSHATGLEGTGKLGSRPLPPSPPPRPLHGQAVPAAPPPAFPSLSGSPSSHFSNKSQRLCGLGAPSTNPTETHIVGAVPAVTGGHGGLCGKSLPRGWPPPPARRLLSLTRGPQADGPRRNPQSRGGGGAGDAPGGRRYVPCLQVWIWEAGFTQVPREPWAPPSGDLSLTHLPWPFPLPSLPISHINYLYPSPYLRVGFGGTQATVDRMMSPNTSMPRSPRTCECVTIDDRTSSLGVIKLST